MDRCGVHCGEIYLLAKVSTRIIIDRLMDFRCNIHARRRILRREQKLEKPSDDARSLSLEIQVILTRNTHTHTPHVRYWISFLYLMVIAPTRIDCARLGATFAEIFPTCPVKNVIFRVSHRDESQFQNRSEENGEIKPTPHALRQHERVTRKETRPVLPGASANRDAWISAGKYVPLRGLRKFHWSTPHSKINSLVNK